MWEDQENKWYVIGFIALAVVMLLSEALGRYKSVENCKSCMTGGSAKECVSVCK